MGFATENTPGGTLEGRLAYFQSFTVAHPHLVAAKDALIAGIRQSEPNAIVMVFGPTGVGKTTLRRRALYAAPKFFNLTSYELVLKDVRDIHEMAPDLIILDEAQRIRNWTTATARTVKQLKSRYAFVLSGTPLENKLEELFSVVEFIDGRRLGPAFRFLHEHRTEDEK